MRKRLVEKLTKSKKGSLGYTLTELLVVIGIIAVLCAIAIPSIITINRALKFRQRNDYAKTIFLAAQANLSEMRSDGSLDMLQGMVDSTRCASGKSGFPTETWASEYYYVTRDDTVLYSLVLPVNSVESTLRNQQVIIEFNPYTGNVYSVFYSEEEDSIFGQYNTSGLPRDDKAARRSMMLGYYDGSALASHDLELEKTKAELEYINGEEGIIAINVPMPSEFYAKQFDFMEGLSIELTITGDTSGGEITVTAKTAGNLDNCSLGADGKTAVVKYPLDSLIDGGSFANKVITDSTITSLTKVASESGFTILPGENVTVKAEVKFTSADAAVNVESGILPGINPLFEYLEPSTSPDRYVLAISNGRNLQNLNVIAPSVAAKVDVVVFTNDVYWNATVKYYNDAYGNGGTYENEREAPARCLPYFVPINNQNLFGSAYFSEVTLPVMQDKHDATALTSTSIQPADHADIMGDGHRVVGLNIDATKYEAQTELAVTQEYYVSNDYQYKTASNVNVTVTNYQRVDYYFTGLFAYANTYIDGLDIVNPIVKGYSYANKPNITTATGALLGASGYNTLVTNCGVYIDKTDPSYNPDCLAGPYAYDAAAIQTWYGVSGQGSVGGLVGYAKSHRTASGNLTDDTSELAFSYCFAAVPVSGDMRGTSYNNTKYYGYTNGVGGFIGNSELTNFYSCYSSGDVLATGCYVQAASGTGTNDGFKPGQGDGIASSGTRLTDILKYEGRTSMGAGGFVGVSHGTRYTNCFTTGDVKGSSASGSAQKEAGVGGFVGIMCYDEGFNYEVKTGDLTASERIEQLTVFDSCYSTGKATIDTKDLENFSGANARIYTYSCDFYVDYYKLFAPYYAAYGVAPSYPSTNDTDNKKNDAYYIYKDSYYLSRNYTANTINISSNDCASVASYDLLTNLPFNHNNSEWLDARVAAIGEYTTANGQRYIDYYKNYNKQSYWTSTLAPKYKEQLKEGFPWVNWRSAMSSNTHPYNMGGGAYPFSKLNNMDYYGDWPTRPLECGLAYYEDYCSEGINGSIRGIFFDSDETSTIRKSDQMESYTLVSDGYAVLSANKSDTVIVQVGGKSFELTGTAAEEPYTPGAEYGTKSFSVFPLNKTIMDTAAEEVAEGKFYVELTVTVTADNQTPKTYTMYFNPNVAKSNINPSSGTAAADPGDAVPDQILIRTARQLAALSTATHSWGENYHYYQELDIDFASYTASSYTSTAAAEIRAAIAGAEPIGSEENPFNASYNGMASKKYSVTRDIQKATDSTEKETGPLFGVIGETGSVRNLTVIVGGAEGTVTVGSAEADTIGIVANVVDGTLDNVDLVLGSPVSVTAATNAGLAAGKVSGKLANVNVTSKATASVSANNAGGVVGLVVGTANASADADSDASASTAAETAVTVQTVTDCGIHFTGPLLLNGTNCGGFAGSYSGSAENVTVALKGLTAELTNNGFAGGYAGVISGTSDQKSNVTNCTVTLSGEIKSESAGTGSTVSDSGSVLGGFAGSAENADLSASSATLGANSVLKATAAAGFVGQAKAGLKVQNTKAYVLGEIRGVNSAAGFAGSMDTNARFLICSACISGRIEAPTAAGFAVTAGGEFGTCLTVLNNGTITGTTEAAGFAGTVSGTVYGGSGVTGSGSITAPTAAGFAITVSGQVAACRVTPAYSQTRAAYLDKNTGYNKLVITSTAAAENAAAGFAVTVESEASVLNCDALGTIAGTKVSCFADTNAGTITGCMANVKVPGGYPFVTSNSGTVIYCYGWFGDGEKTTDLSTFGVEGSCFGSYFVDIDVPVDAESTTKSVVLYTSGGAEQELIPTELEAYSAADLGTAWYDAKHFTAYPFSQSLIGRYPFPMLRQHSGDWADTPQYAYGVIYYEKNADGKLNYRVADLSDPNYTLEEDTLASSGTFTAAGTITNAGYAIFCHSKNDIIVKSTDGTVISDGIGEVPTDGTLAGILSEIASGLNGKGSYSVYPLNAIGKVVVSGTVDVSEDEETEGESPADGTSTNGTAQVVTWFADAINVTDNTYQIRTGEQFSNIRYMSASNFRQTHDLTLDKYTAIDSFSGTFDGNGYTISANTVPGLIKTVSGTVTNMRFTADNATGNIFGTVSKTVQNSTISVGTADSSVIGTVSGTVSGNTISIEAASVSNTSFGIAASQVMSGGELTNNTITGIVNVTGKDSVTATIGGIAGVNGGTISGGSAKVTINYRSANGVAMIGGVAGVNSGTISGDTSKENDVTISYTQASTDEAIIGGLVGRMDSGSISGVNVTGAVNLLPADSATPVSTTDRSYIVGGAIGRDNGAEYSAVSSGVAVSSDWADRTVTPDIYLEYQDMGNGPVGMFVGYVSSGSFANCSSSVEENNILQFLGQVAVRKGEPLPALENTNAKWFSNVVLFNNDVTETGILDTVAKEKGFVPKNAGDIPICCDAVLSNCTFFYKGCRYTQTIRKDYIYQGEEKDITLKPAQMGDIYTTDEPPTYKELYNGDTAGTYETAYYYQVDENNYALVYVKVSTQSSGQSKKYQYILYTEGNADTPIFESEWVTNNNRNRPIKDAWGNTITFTLYKKTYGLPDGKYLITDSSKTYIFVGSKDPVKMTDALSKIDDYLWEKDGNYWKYGGSYLYLNSTEWIDTRERNITVSEYDDGFSLVGTGYNSRYLRFNTGTEFFERSTTQSKICLWIVSAGEDSHQCTFTKYQENSVPVTDSRCVALDSEGNELQPQAESMLTLSDEATDSNAEATVTVSGEEAASGNAEENLQSDAATPDSSGDLTGGDTGNTGS